MQHEELIPIRAPAKEEHLCFSRGISCHQRDGSLWCTNAFHKPCGQVAWLSPWLSHLQRKRTANSHANKTAGRMVAWRQRLRPTVLPYDPLKSWQSVESGRRKVSEKPHENKERHRKILWLFETKVSVPWFLWGHDAVLPISLLRHNCCDSSPA